MAKNVITNEYAMCVHNDLEPCNPDVYASCAHDDGKSNMEVAHVYPWDSCIVNMQASAAHLQAQASPIFFATCSAMCS